MGGAMELLVVLCIGLCSAAYLVSRFRRKRTKLPPGNSGWPGWPFMGETLEYISMHKLSEPHPFFAKRISRYGRVFSSHLFGKPTVLVTDTDAVKFVFQNDNRLFRPSYPRSLVSLMGKWNMASVELDVWKKQRQIFASFMHAIAKDSLVNLVEENVTKAMSQWKQGQVVEIEKEAKAVAFVSVLRRFFSLEIGDAQIRDMLETFSVLNDGIVSVPVQIPGTKYYKAMQARKKILAELSKIITQQQQQQQLTDYGCDLLSVLLRDGGFTEEQMRDMLVGLLFAGYSTTSSSIVFAVKYAKENPRAFSKLCKEHNAIKTAMQGDRLTWSDYQSMAFTQNFIWEVLRCGNPGVLLLRKALEDVELRGYTIPKGWKVAVPLVEVHTCPQHFQDPFKFDPSRWEDTSIGTSSFVGFGGGPRKCMGIEMARLEVAIFLHHLVTRFSWEEIEPQEIVIGVSPRVPNGLKIKITENLKP